MKPIEDLPPYEVVIAYWPDRVFKLGFCVRLPDAPQFFDGLRISEAVNHEEPHVTLETDDQPTHWEWLPSSIKPDALES